MDRPAGRAQGPRGLPETGRWEELTGLCRVAAAVGRDELGLGASFVLQYASRVLVRLSATRQADEVEADADADSCRREDEAPQGCEEGFPRVLVLVSGSLSSCVADLS